tara:strand:+ start:718 stop:1431 length:714 start_codon:yes stop_codon:yes gene_type:complete
MKKSKGLNIALTVVSVLFIGVSGTLLTKYIIKKRKQKKNPFTGGSDAEEFWYKVMYGVIGHEGGRSEVGGSGKDFTDITSLDGGTVGICHFAASGLCNLYKAMDTQKYFGRSASEMCNNWARKDSGAYDQSWWRDGMKKFLNNPNNNNLQIEVCKGSRVKAINDAKPKGWETDREWAIAAGFSNSYGNAGFRKYANIHNWDAESLLSWYGTQSSHKGRREFMVNKWFPKDKAKKIKL